MKTLAIISMTLFCTSGLFAHNNSLERLTKAQKDSTDEYVYQQTSNMIDSMNFVLEANYLGNKYGFRIPVTSNLNFIKVNGKKVVLQTGRNEGLGYNGLGGLTAEGTITDWKVTKNQKNKTFYITMDISSNIGFYTVWMDISGSGRATAYLTGLGPGALEWDGYCVTPEETRTFQGRAF